MLEFLIAVVAFGIMLAVVAYGLSRSERTVRKFESDRRARERKSSEGLATGTTDSPSSSLP